MLIAFPFRIAWLFLIILSFSLPLSSRSQGPLRSGLDELRENDPLSYATVYARRSNNQFALSEIAVHYAELGDFEQAMRVNESAGEEDWRTAAFGKIALEYWKHGQKDNARALFLRVANLPLPKDYIYIWGDIINYMAEAQQFELALEIDNAMGSAGGTTAGDHLAQIVEYYLEAKTHNASLPDILPRVLKIAKALPDSNNRAVAVKKVAVAYATQGQYERATKLIHQFDDDFDREDAAHEVAIQLAKLGRYDLSLRLADEAGDYFGLIARTAIAAAALERRDKAKALELASRSEALITTAMKAEGYEMIESDAGRLSELAILFYRLNQRTRATKSADLAFKVAKGLGKPGERYGALRMSANAYCELGLYDNALVVANELADYKTMRFDVMSEIGAHAQRKGNVDGVNKIIRAIQTAPVEENEQARVKALVAIARAAADQGRVAEAQRLLFTITPFTENLEGAEQAGDTLRSFAVAFAEAGNTRAALQRVPKISEPFYTAQALIDIGMLAAKKRLVFNDGDLTLLNDIAKIDLPPTIEPERLINEAGWEIPGLRGASPLRPPELQRTRDRTIQLYYTYYEPVGKTLIQRVFMSRRKPKAEEAQWTSKGLKISLIEEHVINGRTFCYRLTVYEIFQDNVTGIPRYSANLETLLYYDEDGDGKFETLEEGLSYFAPGHIPKWVLEN